MKSNQRITADHLNLTVKSFEESAAWYEKVFGFQIVEQGLDEDGIWGVLRNGDFMLCIYESPAKKSPRTEESHSFHKFYHLGLRIRDEDAWKHTLKEFSVETHYGSPVRYPHSTSWYVTDPTGYMIEVALWDNDQVQFNYEK